MPTEAEIKAKYKVQHDTLSASYYAGTSGLTKEEFDFQHGKIWSDMEAELIAEGYLTSPSPPLSTHLARLDAINPQAIKPATVTRTWKGKDYIYDCFVTENIKDQWLAGDIVIGDLVLIEYIESDTDKAIVIHKVFKTW